jgi:hypothetical protein
MHIITIIIIDARRKSHLLSLNTGRKVALLLPSPPIPNSEWRALKFYLTRKLCGRSEIKNGRGDKIPPNRRGALF